MVMYDNAMISDSAEPHETLHGEHPSVHLDIKERKA
jgi:hypothetical protein